MEEEKEFPPPPRYIRAILWVCSGGVLSRIFIARLRWREGERRTCLFVVVSEES